MSYENSCLSKRRAELEELRRMSLTSENAARLQDAELPVDMKLRLNFNDFVLQHRESLRREQDVLKEARQYLNSYRGDDEAILSQKEQLRRLSYEMGRQSTLEAKEFLHSYKAGDPSVLSEFKNGALSYCENMRHFRDARSSFYLSLDSSEVEERVRNDQHYSPSEKPSFRPSSSHFSTHSSSPCSSTCSGVVTPSPTGTTSTFGKSSNPSKIPHSTKSPLFATPSTISTFSSTPISIEEPMTGLQEVKDELSCIREQLFDIQTRLSFVRLPSKSFTSDFSKAHHEGYRKTVDQYDGSDGSMSRTETTCASTPATIRGGDQEKYLLSSPMTPIKDIKVALFMDGCCISPDIKRVETMDTANSSNPSVEDITSSPKLLPSSLLGEHDEYISIATEN